MRISTRQLVLTQVSCILLALLVTLSVVTCNDSNDSKPSKAEPPRRKLPKDPMYITDVDLENLYDQWEDTDDEKLPPDELPPHKRPTPSLAMPSGLSQEELLKDPEKLMIASKKGKTVMAFVSIAGKPSKAKTEELTQRWQLGLTNNHIKCERYVIADDRAIFVFLDGILAFEAKDFLLDQPELKEFSIDQRTWQGKGYPVEFPHAKESNKVPLKAGPDFKASHKRDEL